MFVPAHKPEFLASATKRRIDRLILDLEDGLPSGKMPDALRHLRASKLPPDSAVRIPLEEGSHSIAPEVLDCIAATSVSRLMVPKIRSSEQARAVWGAVQTAFGEKRPRIFLLVESPQALWNLPAILAAFDGCVDAVALGLYDYSAAFGTASDSECMRFARQLLLHTAKGNGIEIYDAPLLSRTDREGFGRELALAFADGFDGKLLIHPAQFQWFNEIELLAPEELAELRRVREAIAIRVQQEGVVDFEGKLYEKPHLALIERWLQAGERS